MLELCFNNARKGQILRKVNLYKSVKQFQGIALASGLDIVSFSYVSMRYHLSEKVATSTSVIIMAINSIAGFILHYFIINDFDQLEFNYWLVCIPVVVFGAPLGAYFINNRTIHSHFSTIYRCTIYHPANW